MGRSSSSSSGGSSPAKYESTSESDSDCKQRGPRGRPRRVPTSNSKNAVAARMNRIKQKQYVEDLQRKMSALKREIKSVKKELADREKKWADSVRQVSYLRGMLANSGQIGHLLRNIRWRNIVPQGSNVDKTLNELNSDLSVDRSSPFGTTSPRLFDGCFDLLEDRNDGRLYPVEPLSNAPADNEDWALFDGNNPSSNEVGVCLHVSNRRISVEFCDECSTRFYDDPHALQL